jgi:phenylacetate-coenzyme A ligase PaaK-like adenylate-forming protein
MTAITDSTVPALRARFGRALAARLPEHISRLGWDARQLAGHQRERLRALLACARERSPFHARRLAAVEGRADEIFRYGPVTIDPLVIRTAMVTTPGVVEYQVRQTDHGIDAAVVADGALDHAALASSLRQSLQAAGLREPHVHLHEIAGIARHPQTGKTRRFIAR